MRTWAFAKRTTKEILRDPINIIFGLGFPIVILLLLTTIQKNIPATPFSLKQLTPGIAVSVSYTHLDVYKRQGMY